MSCTEILSVKAHPGAYSDTPIFEVKAQVAQGRRHQIRVHLAAVGAPLLGDVLYGGSSLDGMGKKEDGQAFHALHACTLRFIDPDTHTQRVIEAPLPARLQRYIR